MNDEFIIKIITLQAIVSGRDNSESPVSSTHLTPKSVNFKLQSECFSLHKAFTGATESNKSKIKYSVCLDLIKLYEYCR